MKVVDCQKSSLKNYMENITSSFKTGIDIVEDKIRFMN